MLMLLAAAQQERYAVQLSYKSVCVTRFKFYCCASDNTTPLAKAVSKGIQGLSKHSLLLFSAIALGDKKRGYRRRKG